MSISQISEQFLNNFRQTQWPEWISALSQIVSVWYARKNNVWVYPSGIVGVLLASYVYFFMVHPPLYAYGTLNIYYFIMSVYGWYNWVQKKENREYKYPISWCSPAERLWGIGLFLAVWAILYAVLAFFTNSNTPTLDSLVLAAAVTAMWWMAKRKIENWHAWIVSNLVAIPLNFYKGLMLFTVMYLLFLVMAGWGLADWKKEVARKAKG